MTRKEAKERAKRISENRCPHCGSRKEPEDIGLEDTTPIHKSAYEYKLTTFQLKVVMDLVLLCRQCSSDHRIVFGTSELYHTEVIGFFIPVSNSKQIYKVISGNRGIEFDYGYFISIYEIEER